MKIIVFILCFSAFASPSVLDEWSSPFQYESSTKVLTYGAVATSLLILTKESTIDKVQSYSKERGLLSHDMSKFGDLTGQVIPNILYISGSFIYGKFNDEAKAYKRIKLMTKATFYAGVTTMILKRLVAQKRPDSDNRSSFPSGHTTTAFAFASVVAMEHEWYWGTAAYAMATITAVSRIHDNAHYLHDVVAGATIGTAFGIALSNLADDNDNDNKYSIIPNEDGAIVQMHISY
jgi:hypothetical protein